MFAKQVTRDTHAYLKDIEAREEGGTPGIVESIRAGMVFQLKQVSVSLLIPYQIPGRYDKPFHKP